MPQLSPALSDTLVPISYRITRITDTPDIPVQLKSFRRNVARCKACFGLSCIFGIATEIILIANPLRSRSVLQNAGLGLQVSMSSLSGLSKFSLDMC